MANEYKITDPGAFYYCDEQRNEWLGIDIKECELETCDILWMKSCHPRRGGDCIRQAPLNLSADNSLRLPQTWTRQRLLLPPPDDPEMSSSGSDTVWLGLDVRDIRHEANKDLHMIQFLLIPCGALEAEKIPGFEGGCFP